MEVPVHVLPSLGEQCFGLAAAHAARYLRFIVAADVGVPAGKPGPGGSALLRNPGHIAPYPLACAASPTAEDAGKAAKRYGTLVAHVSLVDDTIEERRDHMEARADLARKQAELSEEESHGAQWRAIADDLDKFRRSYERMIADREPPPDVLLRLRDEPHDLLQALTWLVGAAGNTTERERLLAAHIKVTVERSWPTATIEIDDRHKSGLAFDIYYYDPKELRAHVQQSRVSGPRAFYPCIFYNDVIAAFGALLDPEAAVEREGAPRAEAGGAPSTAGRHPQPEGPASNRDPSANSGTPQPNAAECIAIGAGFPPGTDGTPPPHKGLRAGEDRHERRRPRAPRAARARAS